MGVSGGTRGTWVITLWTRRSHKVKTPYTHTHTHSHTFCKKQTFRSQVVKTSYTYTHTHTHTFWKKQTFPEIAGRCQAPHRDTSVLIQALESRERLGDVRCGCGPWRCGSPGWGRGSHSAAALRTSPVVCLVQLRGF